VRERGAASPVFGESVAEAPAALAPMVKAGDVVLTLGAGDIGTLPARLARRRP
jgi:UDP-N-acetylmuramate--alanine ligase